MQAYNTKHTAAVVTVAVSVVFLAGYTLAIIFGMVKPDISDILVYLIGFAIIHYEARITHEVMAENVPHCCPKETTSHSPSKQDDE